MPTCRLIFLIHGIICLIFSCISPYYLALHFKPNQSLCFFRRVWVTQKSLWSRRRLARCRRWSSLVSSTSRCCWNLSLISLLYWPILWVECGLEAHTSSSALYVLWDYVCEWTVVLTQRHHCYMGWRLIHVHSVHVSCIQICEVNFLHANYLHRVNL